MSNFELNKISALSGPLQWAGGSICSEDRINNKFKNIRIFFVFLYFFYLLSHCATTLPLSVCLSMFFVLLTLHFVFVPYFLDFIPAVFFSLLARKCKLSLFVHTSVSLLIDTSFLSLCLGYFLYFSYFFCNNEYRFSCLLSSSFFCLLLPHLLLCVLFFMSH